MLHQFVLCREFFAKLLELDEQLARVVAEAGCRHCGGPLHRAHYPRKPRGAVFAVAGEAFSLRHSLCCGRPGCRRRTLPPSLRFLGRRVYLEVVVLLASLCTQLAVSLRAAARAMAVPRRTLGRWGRWWREWLPQTALWTQVRAHFAPPPPAAARLPRSLLERLEATVGRQAAVVAAGCGVRDAALLLAARLLAPATTRSVADESRWTKAASRRRLRAQA
jgi:hypothetical protein